LGTLSPQTFAFFFFLAGGCQAAGLAARNLEIVLDEFLWGRDWLIEQLE
jgi:hypothetical protein